jgi:large subunit ribosomal protein L4
MASIDVKNLKGESQGSIDLPAEWFEGKVNVPVMHQVVTAQLSNARQGTHKTKTRAEVAGGGRKPWRQKGTGRARQGSIRSPQFVGGGGNVTVVRDFAFDAPKTKDAVAALAALGHGDLKVLVVLADRHDATLKSFSNLPKVHTLMVDQLNTLDVMRNDVVVFDEAALELIGTGRRASTKTEEVEA